MIPTYELIGVLARHGAVTIYKARDVRFNRLAAVKVVESHVGADELIARLLFEADMHGAVSGHNTVLDVYEQGRFEGAAWFAMELAQGSLEQVLRLPSSASEAAATVEWAARGIDRLHHMGLIHRSINLSHIFLARDGDLKLGGFGSALPIQLPESGGVAVDVHGLGTLLYELLSGRSPTEDRVVLLSPDVPRELETICLGCLGHHPNRRYSTAADVAQDLHRFLRA